jgi:RNA polymerase sigma-70 factor (ECF subfamily)
VADDRELWERICQGDVRAFEDFYQENAPRLLRFLRQLLGESQAAEDVAQETFLGLWQRPNGFRPERGSLRAYVFGIGRKRSADWWRRRGAVAKDTEREADSATAEDSSLVNDALSRLEANQRALLWLREVEGQSYEKLAEILEVPLGTVKSRLFTAREELRRIWRGQKTEEPEKL